MVEILNKVGAGYEVGAEPGLMQFGAQQRKRFSPHVLSLSALGFTQ